MKTKLIFIGCTVILLAIIGLAVFSAVNRAGRVAVEIIVAPRDATVSINGNTVSGSTAHVEPGRHTIEVSRDGFSSFRQDFTASEDTEPFTIALSPQTSEARELVARSGSDWQRVEERAGELERESGQSLIDSHPIIAKLPHHSSFYQIDYGIDENGSQVIIQIRADLPYARMVALETIRSWGFEPTDYVIEFPGLDNPFEEANR